MISQAQAKGAAVRGAGHKKLRSDALQVGTSTTAWGSIFTGGRLSSEGVVSIRQTAAAADPSFAALEANSPQLRGHSVF